MRGIIGVVVVTLGLGCAPVAPPPALVEARARYDVALQSERARIDPKGLWAVKGSLDKANQAFAKEPQSKKTEAAAYRALNELLRWQANVDVARAEAVTAPLEKLEASDPATRELALGRFTPRTESDQRIGALGAAVEGMGSLKQEERGLVMHLASNKLFPPAGAELTAPAKHKLADTADAIARYAPDARVRVVASIDYPAESTINQAAAVKRARAVRDELVKTGVRPENISFGRADVAAPIDQQVDIVVEPLNPPQLEQ